ncbi:peptidoglycan N-acetylmuramoylhydrolase [Magnetococcus marinus MC-1]|uniref:Peptidoglycan N-acetylmuramoylhydrolase n=1 Tax=Magnetococcus marinus (strain ATCC BAA-1437 / JCM 17883 / MC-1) TaxID=156889 RepID=A0L7N5_MAGMM|nr:lytic murein transglycosylase [Magnetococcus marinus]ABK43978.1 peptidoglycan N-acetylmuramoylhydrolase [Magnetococcus marinus MC-1]
MFGILNRREMLRGTAATLLLPGILTSAHAGQVAEDPLLRYPWLAQWAGADGLDAPWLRGVFQNLKKYPRVIRAMNHQAEAKPFYLYREHVTSPWLYKKGREAWQQHRAMLEAAGARYGVDAPFVLALWGMESRFGRNQGEHPVLRTLFTLAVDYPRRQTFFRQELRHFLILCRQQGWDPMLLKGSYAGAMGHVQMIPSSLRYYAVDGDGDGRLDVFNNPMDATASIAHYLGKHGWELGGPYLIPVYGITDLSAIKSAKVKEMQPWSSWYALGVRTRGEPPPAERAMALIALEEQDGLRYYGVFNNFRVILDWNRSTRFAKVVGELAEGFVL